MGVSIAAQLGGGLGEAAAHLIGVLPGLEQTHMSLNHKIGAVLPPGVPELSKIIVCGYYNTDEMKKQLSYYAVKPFAFPDGMQEFDPFWQATILVNGKMEQNPAYHAQPRNYWDQSWQLSQYLPNIEEIFALQNRGYMGESAANWYFQRHGIRDKTLRDQLKRLRYEIPPLTDLVLMGVHEVFHPPIMATYGLIEEYPTPMTVFAEQLGYGGKTGIPLPAHRDTFGVPIPAHEASWAELEWAAHWTVPSPGQGYEFLQRYYTESRFGPSPDVLDDNGQVNPNLKWDMDDLRLMLRRNDYPQYFRDRLAGISYQPIGRIDVRRLYKTGIYTRQQVYHAYRRIGYNDKDALDLMRWTVQSQSASFAREICTAYTIGLIDRLEATRQYKQMGLSDADIESSLYKCDLDAANSKAKTAIASVKSSYLHGVITTNDVKNLLMQIGIQNKQMNDYVFQWQLDKAGRRKFPAAAKILDWYSQGILSGNEVTARLQNLDYDGGDVQRMILETDRRNQDKQGKEYEKQYTKQQQEQKKLADATQKGREKQAKDSLTQTQKAQAKADKDILAGVKANAAYFTDKVISAWRKSGLIGDAEIASLLAIRGLNQSSIDRWFAANPAPAEES